MPFSSLSDPADLARAHALLEAAWGQLENRIPLADRAEARTQLTYLAATSLQSSIEEADLVQHIIDKFECRPKQ